MISFQQVKKLKKLKAITELNILVTFEKNRKYMDKTLFLAILLLITISCGTQRQLQKAFVGKRVTEVAEKFGAPISVIDKDDEKIYIFEKEEELRRTEIDQGKLTLDPIVTPKVVKTNRYYFTVKEGVVTKARMEEEYER